MKRKTLRWTNLQLIGEVASSLFYTVSRLFFVKKKHFETILIGKHQEYNGDAFVTYFEL
ncbi:hypothetical protein [Glaciimonas sp. PAMC28666]|uniref:hypothetical protein n=1 Tax=Glaciimonas sp. PAMC28666 TaxID=2807626 RepID=UPI0019649DA2|nr:hypothetical protein [Glaciimonas sp. PAMC28666]QRX83670.1 hypothetical protein JQN73_05430 [Glaciimonas sp. PAMC28666]